MAFQSPQYLTRVQSRAVDEIAIRDFGITGLVLMENAGRGSAEFIIRYLENHPETRHRAIAICCGKGNNGGDGFVIARHLAIAGFAPTVLLWTNPAGLTGDALANYAILAKTRTKIVNFDDASWEAEIAVISEGKTILIDALLGTGAVGKPWTPYDRAIAWINSLSTTIFAIDLPSGLDADSGRPSQNTIRADYTLTFVAQKTGFASAEARPFLGEIHVLDIGVPLEVIAAAQLH